MRDRKDYSVRAVKHGNDELGVLIDGFNEMLGEIQARDVELTVAKEMAEEASRTKSGFLATMSHELRTPLNAILGYSEMLIEDLEGRDQHDVVADLRRIHGAGSHLLALINDILDLSKIEAAKLELHLERCAVSTVIDEVATVAHPLVRQNGNTLEVACADNLGVLVTDVMRLRQILFNLVSNAAKFTERGTIALRAFREGAGITESVVFEVRDTGIGMTPEQLVESVPALLPGRFLDEPEYRRHRPRARHHPAAGAHTRRRCDCRQRAARINNVHGSRPPRRLTPPPHEVQGDRQCRACSGRGQRDELDMLSRHLMKHGWDWRWPSTAPRRSTGAVRRPDPVLLDLGLPEGRLGGREAAASAPGHAGHPDHRADGACHGRRSGAGPRRGCNDYDVKAVNLPRLEAKSAPCWTSSAAIDERIIREIRRRLASICSRRTCRRQIDQNLRLFLPQTDAHAAPR